MDQREDHRSRRVLFQGGDDGCIGVEVTVDFSRFDVEDVDEDLGIAEDVFSLRVEVRVHEGILTELTLLEEF